MTKLAALRITAPDGGTSGIDLAAGPITVGRRVPDHNPDVPLGPDPQRWVGRLHCTLDHADGLWTVVDNASVNGTLLRHGGSVTRLQGCKRIQHGDAILILGDMGSDGSPLYWELLFLDPHRTQPAPFGPPPDVLPAGPCLRYDWVSARAIRVVGDVETPISGLRPKGHQLLRFMAGRGNGVSVACGHDELIRALWGESDESPHRSYDRTDLAGVVRAVRRCIEIDPSAPQILETVTGLGYRLNVRPDGPVDGAS